MTQEFYVKSPNEILIRIDLASKVEIDYYVDMEDIDGFRVIPDRFKRIKFQFEIPIILKSDSWPYKLLTELHKSTVPPCVAVTICKRHTNSQTEPTLDVTLDGLQPLSDIFGEDSPLTVVISHDSGKDFPLWQTVDTEIAKNQPTNTKALLNHDISNRTKIAWVSQYVSYGDIPRLSGTFSVHASWVIRPRPKPPRETVDSLQSLICTWSPHWLSNVQAIASNGKGFKIPKSFLAAFSQKFLRQFEYNTSGGTLCESTQSSPMKIYTGSPLDSESHLGEPALKAFLQFLLTHSVTEPMRNPRVAIELLMAGHYNIIPEMENSMQKLLLGLPREMFDLETLHFLYIYVSTVLANFHIPRDRLAWEKLQLLARFQLELGSEGPLHLTLN